MEPDLCRRLPGSSKIGGDAAVTYAQALSVAHRRAAQAGLTSYDVAVFLIPHPWSKGEQSPRTVQPKPVYRRIKAPPFRLLERLGCA